MIQKLDSLKNCPICNQSDQVIATTTKDGWHDKIYSVGCIRCEIDTYCRLNLQAAIDHWNGLPRSVE